MKLLIFSLSFSFLLELLWLFRTVFNIGLKTLRKRKSALNSLCDLIYKEDFAPECVEDSKFPLALYTLTFAAQCIVMVEFCYFLRQAKNMWFDKC